MLQNSTQTSIKTIYLIRHGQTDFNQKGIVQGSGIDSELNTMGKQQALRFYREYQDVKFDKIYISELKRTYQTVAQFIAAGLPYQVLSELNEINWGELEGKSPDIETNRRFEQTVKQWRNGNLDFCVSGGESPNQLYLRQRMGLQKILSNTSEKEVLVCMHGRAMRSFLCLLTATPLSKMDDFEHANVCLYKLQQIEPNATEFKIILHNHLAHLA